MIGSLWNGGGWYTRPCMRSSRASRPRNKQATQKEEKRMATSPSVFPFAHIALTAAITAVVALLVLVVLRPRFKMLSLVDCLLVAVVVGISVMVWRSAGQTGAFEKDPISPVSPKYFLCSPGMYLVIRLFPALPPP